MNHEELEKYLLSFENTWRDESLDEKLFAYRVGDAKSADATLFALVERETSPLRVSLRCDELLAKTLRERYETVVVPRNLNRKTWNTVVCTGQLSNDEVFDLVRLSYRLATGAVERN